MNNNEPDTLPDPAIGYIFQNDIVALKQAFSLPDIDYADISQREQLAACAGRCWQKLRNKVEEVNGRTGIAGVRGAWGQPMPHAGHYKCWENVWWSCLPGQLVAPVI